MVIATVKKLKNMNKKKTWRNSCCNGGFPPAGSEVAPKPTCVTISSLQYCELDQSKHCLVVQSAGNNMLTLKYLQSKAVSLCGLSTFTCGFDCGSTKCGRGNRLCETNQTCIGSWADARGRMLVCGSVARCGRSGMLGDSAFHLC